MRLDELLDVLDQSSAALVIVDGRIRYRGPRLASGSPIRGAIDEHRAELIALLTPAPVNRDVRVNPGMLMTLGHEHGYPRLPLSPGISIAESERYWRAFIRTARPDMLALAAAAACRTWSDDPMVGHLAYIDSDDASIHRLASSGTPIKIVDEEGAA